MAFLVDHGIVGDGVYLALAGHQPDADQWQGLPRSLPEDIGYLPVSQSLDWLSRRRREWQQSLTMARIWRTC